MGKTKDIAKFDEYNGSYQEAGCFYRELTYALDQVPYWTSDPDPEDDANVEKFGGAKKEIIRGIRSSKSPENKRF